MSCSKPSFSASVQRLDVVALHADVARVVVFWLGRYAKLAEQANGCIPAGLVEAQHAIAEAVAAVGDSRPRECSRIAGWDIADWERDELMDTTAAAAHLGLKPTTVTLHCRAGRLGQKVGREWVIRASELEVFQRERVERGA
jgi:hypothetical protein